MVEHHVIEDWRDCVDNALQEKIDAVLTSHDAKVINCIITLLWFVASQLSQHENEAFIDLFRRMCIVASDIRASHKVLASMNPSTDSVN